MTFSAETLKLAHRHSSAHRNELMDSESCACFYCKSVFPPSSIDEWIEETSGALGEAPDPWTALCPVCGVDSVIGSNAPFPVAEVAFLDAMNALWFGETAA